MLEGCVCRFLWLPLCAWRCSDGDSLCSLFFFVKTMFILELIIDIGRWAVGGVVALVLLAACFLALMFALFGRG